MIIKKVLTTLAMYLKNIFYSNAIDNKIMPTVDNVAIDKVELNEAEIIDNTVSNEQIENVANNLQQKHDAVVKEAKIVEIESEKYNALSTKWEENAKSFRELIAAKAPMYNVKSTPVFIEEIKTITGDVYFSFANPEQLPVLRDEEIQMLLGATMLGVDKNGIEKIVLSFRDILAKQDAKEALKAIQDLHFALTEGSFISQIINLGAASVVRHDENPFEFNLFMHNKKIKAIKEDCYLRAFFMEQGIAILKTAIPNFTEEFLSGKFKDTHLYIKGTMRALEEYLETIK